MKAVLAGTAQRPEVRLWFEFGATHARSDKPLTEWVKGAPSRYWDGAERCWVIKAFGQHDPDKMLRRAGFDIELAPQDVHPSLVGVGSLAELSSPLVKRLRSQPSMAVVYPRLAGWEVSRDILGPAAIWDKAAQRWRVPLVDLLMRNGKPRWGLSCSNTIAAAARELVGVRHEFDDSEYDDDTLHEDARALALSTGIDIDADHAEQIERLAAVVGDVPDWFGVELLPYQRLGAIAAVSGRSFIADDTGLGKTFQAIAALAIKDVDRAVIVVPPVVLTNWLRELERSGLAQDAYVLPRKQKDSIDTDDSGARWVVTFRGGRKEPVLPHRGVVLVADSLLASREHLVPQLVEWGPQALVYDEAHRARSWTSKRSEVMRRFAQSLPSDALRIPMTATPLFANPQELCGPLAISGHLDAVFGGYNRFIERYCVRNHFKALEANRQMLPHLRTVLSQQVWVRRRKKDVLTELPDKRRFERFVDVDLAGFRRAHEEVIDKITQWLEEYIDSNDGYPDQQAIWEFSRSRIELMSPLRKAAGLAKVPVAIDMISDWINSEVTVQDDGSFTCERPLIVWVHHREVVEALVEAVGAMSSGSQFVRVISGATSDNDVGRIVEAFQAGRVPVLIGSITAAGVGITLTRSSDAWFLEADYSPPIMTQAEDRIHRLGQTKGVAITTIVAEGTLDGRIQQVLSRKAEVLDAVYGTDDADVSVAAGDDGPAEIIRSLLEIAIERHKRAH